VVTSLVNDYLTQYNSTVSCIDFTVNADFDLVITKLCIDAPYADLELSGVLVEWHFKPSYLTLDKVVEAISLITINSVDVRATDDISFTASTNQSPKPLNELPNNIRQLMHDIASYTVPLAINIENFNYKPFINPDVNGLDSDAVKQGYQGKLSAKNKKLLFSLADDENKPVLSLNLARTGTDFTANISTDLAKFIEFINLHQSIFSPILPAHFLKLFSTVFDNKIGKQNAIKGEFTSQINWHNQALSMSNTLSNFSFTAEQGIARLGSVKADAILAWQSHLVDEHLQIDFDKNSVINVVTEQEKLTAFLFSKLDNQTLKALIKDNPVNALSIGRLGSVNVDFNQQSINSEGITLISENLTKPLTLSLSESALNYSDKSLRDISFQEGKFKLQGLAKITQLQPYNKQPVKLNIVGEITHTMHTWQIELNQETVIEISQLSFKENKAKSLISHWQGKVIFVDNNSESKVKSQKNSTSDVTFNLQINNQISQLNLPPITQVKSLELNTMLSGNIDNIVINGKVIVDALPVAAVKLTGDVRQPSIVVSARDVLLTDILALNVKPPISLKLIDGTLSYQLSGQLKNTQDLLANSMLLAFSVKDVTGEIDGTWLQELNWQQDFDIKNGKIQSLTADVKGHAEGKVKAENNLTIAKIETATAITDLSASTHLDFSQGKIRVKAKNINGNLLGGRFEVVRAQWPFSKDSAVIVKLTKIDLEKLLELDKKQGIVVTGKVSGEFPIFYDGKDLFINEGYLHNVGGGLIQVFNNPAVEELKTSSTELKLAFDALENLHYHHLSSDVSMGDDGYMLLVTEIKGRNPDLDNEVNLNLNLSYDLLGLLESLNITEHFENKVIKGLQKKN